MMVTMTIGDGDDGSGGDFDYSNDGGDDLGYGDYFITLIGINIGILHLFFFKMFFDWKCIILDHLECPKGPSLKIVQLRRFCVYANMAAE